MTQPGEKIVNSRERSYMNTKNVIAGTRTHRKRKLQSIIHTNNTTELVKM